MNFADAGSDTSTNCPSARENRRPRGNSLQRRVASNTEDAAVRRRQQTVLRFIMTGTMSMRYASSASACRNGGGHFIDNQRKFDVLRGDRRSGRSRHTYVQCRCALCSHDTMRGAVAQTLAGFSRLRMTAGHVAKPGTMQLAHWRRRSPRCGFHRQSDVQRRYGRYRLGIR